MTEKQLDMYLNHTIVKHHYGWLVLGKICSQQDFQYIHSFWIYLGFITIYGSLCSNVCHFLRQIWKVAYTRMMGPKIRL